MEDYHPIPQPHEIDTQRKEQAMASYMMMFFSQAVGLPLPVINFIASIIYYSVIKKKGLFVKFHAFQSLLSQIPITIVNGYAVIQVIINLINNYTFSDVFIGYLITAGVFNLIYIVFSIIAAVKSYKGRMYYFILFGRIAYHNTFKIKENVTVESGTIQHRNTPPKM